MRESEIRQLIKLVEESDIESLEVRRFFRTIRISKRRQDNRNGSSGAHQGHHLVDIVATPPAHVAAPIPAPVPAPPPVAPSNLVEVKAPMVGTFYRAPAPGAAPFVDINKQIAPGDVLCIIEAMKLMNEIEAEQGGRITKILVEDGQPIEFGQPLFLLDPAG